jgi:hypothetical protein
MSKQEITGNRDASYSNWQRRKFCSGYGVWDDDTYDPMTVYRLTCGYDEELLPIHRAKWEVKGIVRVDNTLYLPDTNRYHKQYDAIRADAKRYDRFGNRVDIPAFCVYYLLEEDIKFFLVVALNKVCLSLLGQRIKPLSEAEYVKFFLSLMETSFRDYSEFDGNGVKLTKKLFEPKQKDAFIRGIKNYFHEL